MEGERRERRVERRPEVRREGRRDIAGVVVVVWYGGIMVSEWCVGDGWMWMDVDGWWMDGGWMSG